MRCGVYEENHGIPAKRFQMAAYSVQLRVLKRRVERGYKDAETDVAL